MKKTALVRRSPMKSKGRPKMTKARASARGEDCTIDIPGCPNATETTVLCHFPRIGGNGMGMKCGDYFAGYGDMYCHDRIDGRAKMPPLPEGKTVIDYMHASIERTHARMAAKGIVP